MGKTSMGIVRVTAAGPNMTQLAGSTADLSPNRARLSANATERLHQACCPAGSRISRVISLGWEISERWLDLTSSVVAFIRLAVKRSGSGFIVRSSVEAA